MIFSNIFFLLLSIPFITFAQETCDAFSCDADSLKIPNAPNHYGNSFEECCRCSYGHGLTFGAVAEGKFHRSSMEMELWLDAPVDMDMHNIWWKHASSDELGYSSGEETAWSVSSPSNCRSRYTLKEDIDKFFGEGTHFTYDKKQGALKTLFQLAGDRAIHRKIGSYDSIFQRHLVQDVPVLVGLDSNATVEASFETVIPFGVSTDIQITGLAEESFEEGGDIVLSFNIISGSCVEHHLVLVEGQNFVDGEINVDWGEAELLQPSADVEQSFCSQDVTVTFKKAKDVFNAQLKFEFQEQAASDSGSFVYATADMHIIEPSILDSLPIRSTLLFYGNDTFSETSDSFGLGETVYGEITATTVIEIDSIELSSVQVSQMGYDGFSQTWDLMTEDSLQYSGSYIAPNHYRFSFELGDTRFHVTEEGQLADITADFQVTYADGSTTRRSLSEDNGFSSEATAAFSITAPPEERVSIAAHIRKHYRLFVNGIFCMLSILIFYVYMHQKSYFVEESRTYILVEYDDSEI